jgi:tRNA threonylcarbamoyladenosine biosynthesis protein TsaE
MRGIVMFLVKSDSENKTFEFGKKLGNVLKNKDIVCLDGDLGTGKTVIAKGIAKGLLVEDYITSPTFTLVNEYNGKYNLYHFDVYRIGDIDEMYDLGFLDYIDDGVCIIEWSELISEIIPKESIKIKIEKDENNYDLRNIYIDSNLDRINILKESGSK